MTLELKDAVCMNGVSPQQGSYSLVVNGGEVKLLQADIRLIRAIMGIEPLESGYITVDGELMTEQSACHLRKLMGYVPCHVKWAEDTLNKHPLLEMRQKMFSDVASRRCDIVIVEHIYNEEERTLCQELAGAGTAVLIINKE